MSIIIIMYANILTCYNMYATNIILKLLSKFNIITAHFNSWISIINNNIL